MRTSTKFLIAGLLAVAIPLTDLAAQRRRGLVDVSPNHERHGFWLTGGLGAGWENYRFDVPGEWQDKDQAAPSLWLSLGGTVSPHLRLGGEFNAWVHEHQDLESGFNVTESLVGALLVGQVYPARNLGLFLKGGIGVSRSGSDISGPGNSVGETGFAWLGGLGYEIRLARNIFLSPVASLMYHTSGDRNAPEGNLKERVLTVGVGFTFQPGR
jgi:hypothetical protein